MPEPATAAEPRIARKGGHYDRANGYGRWWAMFARPVKLRAALELCPIRPDGGEPGGPWAAPPIVRRTRRRILIVQRFGMDW